MNCQGHKGFPKRVFFWCTSTNWIFSELPEHKENMAPLLDQIQSFFSGQHDRQIVDRMGFSQFGHLNLDCIDRKKMPENGLTELDRLIFVVHNIEKNCQIVPCGSYMKSPSQEIQKNEAFSGCTIQQLTDPNCYMHLR